MSVADTAVQEAEQTVEAVAEPVVAEAEKIVEKVAEAIIQIAAEEKLTIREIELEYLKAVMETQRLQKIIEEKAKAFPAFVESLVTKYAIDKTKYSFDATITAFRKM